MDFENEGNFEEFTTTIDTLDLDKDKDLPALTCVDLFPDPPHLIARSDEPHRDDSLADEDEFAGFKTTDSNQTDERNPSPNPLKDKMDNVKIVEPPQAQNTDEQVKSSSNTTGNSSTSAPVSPASYFSSAESVASSASSSKKSKKRYCWQCDTYFRKTRDLLEHLKLHVTVPDVRVERLSDENEKVKEYLSSITAKPSPTHGSLKLKFKLLDSQNFEVVASEKGDKPVLGDPNVQVLKASDIRCKSEVYDKPIMDPFVQNVREGKLTNSFLPPESRYFECPTFDGLDAFADDMLQTAEATDDLLKKLLENNKEQQLFPKEADWQANANEFISIDSLAPRCNVCHMNFSHPKYLYEHKQITGHDFLPRMADTMPNSQPDYGQHRHNNFMQAPLPPPQNLPPLYQMAQMRGNFPGYGPRMNIRQIMHHHPQPSPPPGFHPSQCMMTRTPPPLYRMNGNQPNYQPNRYIEKRPDMYGPAPQYNNGHQQVNHQVNQQVNQQANLQTNQQTNLQANQQANLQANQQANLQANQQPNQDMMRQPIFLKSRLQKAIRGRAQGPTNEMPPSPGILTQQTAIRPRFLGPTPQMPGQMHFQRTHVQSPPKQGEPPTKKVKLEPNPNQFSSSSSSSNGMVSPQISSSPGMPVIQSVHSGVNANSFGQMVEKSRQSPSNNNEQNNATTKSNKTNPKDVAHMLATRGITVTHKGKTSFVSLANKGANCANASAEEAVQKLQANNSVSIISKKKPLETIATKSSAANGGSATKFLSCPVITCKDKFLTIEGVNRHAFRWHGIPMPNPDRLQKRIIRCRICHHICASQEILQEHIRREHEPSVNEIGIPIVDLRNEEVKRKLAALGIFNYVPLTAAGASTSSLAFPVVSVQGAGNPSICNLSGLGASSVLSLGPVKSIGPAIRKLSNDSKFKNTQNL